MSTEENKAIVRRVIDAMNAHNINLLVEISSPDQAAAVREIMQFLDATFEGHHAEITDMVAEGDQVWVRLATSGGHTGEFQGIPATGKQWTNHGVLFYRLAEGKIVAVDALFDELNHIKQLGGSITPPAS